MLYLFQWQNIGGFIRLSALAHTGTNTHQGVEGENEETEIVTSLEYLMLFYCLRIHMILTTLRAKITFIKRVWKRVLTY